MYKGNIYQRTIQFIDTLGPLEGKVVVDIPAGTGLISKEFAKRGAKVLALDLYPEKIAAEGVEKIFADMNDDLPLEDNSVDIVLCQEGIEHIHNQFGLLKELNRKLKTDGLLLITTPSLSHLRSRVSMMLVESEYWKRMPASEVDSVWFLEQNLDRLYFGHIYLITVNHLRALTALTGFKTVKRIPTHISNSSVLLFILLYPLIVLASCIAFIDSYRKNRKHWNKKKWEIYVDQIKLNLSPVTLLCKDIFWVMRKRHDWKETLRYLKKFEK